jgi:hypothetical protein
VPGLNDSVLIGLAAVRLPAQPVAVARLLLTNTSVLLGPVGGSAHVIVSDRLSLSEKSSVQGAGLMELVGRAALHATLNVVRFQPVPSAQWQLLLSGANSLSGEGLAHGFNLTRVEGSLTWDTFTDNQYASFSAFAPVSLAAGGTLAVAFRHNMIFAGTAVFRGRLLVNGSTEIASDALLLSPQSFLRYAAPAAQLSVTGGVLTIQQRMRLNLPLFSVTPKGTVAPMQGIALTSSFMYLAGLLRGSGPCELRVVRGGKAGLNPGTQVTVPYLGSNWHLVFEGDTAWQGDALYLSGLPGSNCSGLSYAQGNQGKVRSIKLAGVRFLTDVVLNAVSVTVRWSAWLLRLR